MVKECVIGLDLGGTWMKGCAMPMDRDGAGTPGPSQMCRNPLHATSDPGEFAARVESFCRTLAEGATPVSLVASTAGEVDATGMTYICAGSHLGVMGSSAWTAGLKARLQCPVVLINDAEAFLLGAAEKGHVSADRQLGALVIGTGLGYAVIRRGRWWKPDRRLIHLGAIGIAGGDYNRWVSAVIADSQQVFDDAKKSMAYFDALSSVAATAVHVHHLKVILLGGGLIDAAAQAGIDPAREILSRLPSRLLPGFACPEVEAVAQGNRTILEGSLALAVGNRVAESARFERTFSQLPTEARGEGPGIETFSPEEIVTRLANEENRAAARFISEAPALATGAGWIADSIRAGGRVIYLGAGTSGRLGALDAVEIPCTFGLSSDRFVAVLAGGVADAALSIEEHFEEDTSSVADLIPFQLGSQDIVVGISASGSAFFVRSGLAYAKSRGARTIFLHEATADALADLSITLHSGPEVVAGSTRLKAGTATKKALNILSTTSMILLGKVRGGEMIDVVCCNAKLRERAEGILMRQTACSHEEAVDLLSKHGYRLREVLESLLNGARMEE